MILAIIQARLGSSRLPGKVLLELAGKPVLWHVVNRVSKSKWIDQFMVATPAGEADRPIIDFCKDNNINCFAGSENDVLDRYYRAAKDAGLKKRDGVVRITADCPLLDPEVFDRVIGLFVSSGADYASNINPPTFPDGLDVEVFTFAALERAWREAALMSEREHVTPFIRNHTDYFTQVNLQNDDDLSHLRWTLDEQDDYEFIKIIYERLYRIHEMFFTKEILAFMKNSPEVLEINNRFKRNEGYEKSL